MHAWLAGRKYVHHCSQYNSKFFSLIVTEFPLLHFKHMPAGKSAEMEKQWPSTAHFRCPPFASHQHHARRATNTVPLLD